MTENTEQGYTAADVAALGSILAGVLAIILATFLPTRDIAIAVIVAILAIGVAIFGGTRATSRSSVWFSRIGSLAGAIAIVIVVIAQLIL